MTVRKFVLAASLAASAVLATPVFAADLGYRGQAYDDPRYSDIYRHPAPPPPPIYREDRYIPAPPPPAYRHEQRYGYDGQRDGRREGCVPREQVRDRLEARGWQDFHDPQPMGNVVHIRARRPNGRLFDLTLDRCSGEVLNAEVIDNRAATAPPPPQDWRYGPAPYERPYQRY